MTGSNAAHLGSGRKRDSLRGEALALGAMAFAIVALIAISLVNLDRSSVVTVSDGEQVPVRVVATSGG